MMKIYLILDNIRSLYNIGSIFRTCDGAGVEKIYLTGICGYPEQENDQRKRWEIENANKKIHKTALGAEKTIAWEYVKDPLEVVNRLQKRKFEIIALEKNENSTNIYQAEFNQPMALIVGNEVDGVSPALLKTADQIIHIPMQGVNKSLNVAIATAIAVYEIKNKSHKGKLINYS